MEKKKIKKLMLKRETISNLSKFEQGGIIGGYDPGGSGTQAPICTCVIDCYSWPGNNLCPKISDYCPPSVFNGGTCYMGGDCDSTDDPAVGCHTDRYC